MKHVLFGLTLSAVALACVPKPVIMPVAPVSADASEYSPFQGSGTASISGQAFLVTRGGESKKAAGREVTLDPATPYAMRWYGDAGVVFKRYAELPSDSLFHRARRTTMADADGRFRFSSLPAGRYIVRTLVTWEVPFSRYTTTTEGGIVAEILTVAEGESKDVILSRMPAKP